MNKYDFLLESLKNIKTVGTLARSSKVLSESMCNDIDFSKDIIIAELGVGDGVITEEILKRLSPKSKLIAFEINENFFNLMQEKFKDERIILVKDSAEFIKEHLDKNGVEDVDYVISAIPFTNIDKEEMIKILMQVKGIIKKNGFFVQYHYTRRIKKVYEAVFGNIDIKFVPMNFPPAFIMKCIKND
jgi:phospholipid N-methyltransferase